MRTVEKMISQRFLATLLKGSKLAIFLCGLHILMAGQASSKPLESKTIGPELIVNGSFEQCTPDFDGPWYSFPAPSTAIAGWTVGLADVDLHQAPAFQVLHGRRYVDLNGYNNGSIRQQINTEPGASYLISFYMTTNPDGGSVYRPMYVRAGKQTKSFSPRTEGASRENSQWGTYTMEFTATEAKTVIEFASKVPAGVHGAVIDNVSVKKIDPSKVQKVDPNQSPFADFTTTPQRLQDSLRLATRNQIVDAGTNFLPNQPVTRVDFVKWLVRIRHLDEVSPKTPTYDDVPVSDVNYKYVETATKEKLVNDFDEEDETLFKPQQNITRENFAELYCIFTGKHESAEKLSAEQLDKDLRVSSVGEGGQTFSDLQSIPEASRRWVACAQRDGILFSTFGIDPCAKAEESRAFSFGAPVTRAEALQALVKLYGP